MALQASIVDPAEFEAATRAAEAEVLMAAETFGAALRTSPEFVRLALAEDALSADAEAKAATEAFRSRQDELRVSLMFGQLTDEERTELGRLQAAMLGCASVDAYVEAQWVFRAVCRETAAVLSGQIGLDFPANCRAGGCCG